MEKNKYVYYFFKKKLSYDTHNKSSKPQALANRIEML